VIGSMAETIEYDLVVIGGGPAGYAGAIRAAQLGAKVACIEMERAGGTCLNWGCIPSKALLRSAEVLATIRSAEEFGISVGKVEFDFKKIMLRSRKVADTMGKGIEALFRKNKVTYLLGRAQVNVPGMVEILEGRDAGKFVKAKTTLVATGCKPRRLPNLPVDGRRVMTSREALAMTEQPKSIAIIGAGAIGVEFAYFLNMLGTQVTLIEALPSILPVEDDDISAALTRSFTKQGIGMRVGTRFEDVEIRENDVVLKLAGAEGKKESLTVDSVLVAIGVEANLDGVFSPKVKPQLDRGYLVVDDRYQTTVPGIYAAGDIQGPPWLAHVATFRAVQAVQGILGHSEPRMVRDFPGCTYCQPQVASVGMTERAVKEKGLAYRIGKFPFSASGKAVAVNHSEGFVKLVLGEEHGEILGAHIIGHDATELISEYVVAQKNELTAEEIHGTIHAHPTMSEALAEAAASAYQEAIHI